MTEKTCGVWAWTPHAPPTIFPWSVHAVSKEIPQSYNADQPTVTLVKAADQSFDIRRTTK